VLDTSYEHSNEVSYHYREQQVVPSDRSTVAVSSMRYWELNIEESCPHACLPSMYGSMASLAHSSFKLSTPISYRYRFIVHLLSRADYVTPKQQNCLQQVYHAVTQPNTSQILLPHLLYGLCYAPKKSTDSSHRAYTDTA
jgi:hypothetical protein